MLPERFVPVALGVRRALLANQPGATGGSGDTGPTGQPTPPGPTGTPGSDYGWRMSDDGGWVPTTYRSPSPAGDAGAGTGAAAAAATGWVRNTDGSWTPPGGGTTGQRPVATTQSGYSLQGMNRGSHVGGLINGGAHGPGATPPQTVLGTTGWQKVEGRWEPPANTETGGTQSAGGSSEGPSGTFFARRVNVADDNDQGHGDGNGSPDGTFFARRVNVTDDHDPGHGDGNGGLDGTFFARRVNVIAGDDQPTGGASPPPSPVQPNALGPGSFGTSPYTVRGGPGHPVPTQMPPAPQRQELGLWQLDLEQWPLDPRQQRPAASRR